MLKSPRKTDRSKKSARQAADRNQVLSPAADFATELLESRVLFAVPNGPFDAAASFANNAVTVTWNSSSTDESGFHIERETAGGSFALVATVPAGQTSFSDTAISSNTQYQYQVTAFYNGGGDSSAADATVTSGTLSSNAGAYRAAQAVSSSSVPNGPFALTATATSSTSVNLSWYSSSGNTESGFKIIRLAAGGSYSLIATVGTGVTSYTDNTAAAGTSYTYAVGAYSAGGDSSYTPGISVTTPGTSTTTTTGSGGSATTVPNGPFALSTTSTTSGIVLNWYSSSNNEAGFQIMRSTSGGAWTSAGTVGAGVTTFTDTAVTAGTTYSYEVYAFNNKGNSSDTNASYITAGSSGSGSTTTTGGTTTSSGGASTSGSGISFKPSGGSNSIPYGPFALADSAVTTSSITLSWYSSSNGSEGGFVIYRKYGNGGVYVPVGVTATNVTTWTDYNVTQGTHYTYEVAAFSSAGLSAYTNELTCSPLASSGVAASSSGTASWPSGFFSIGTYLQPITSFATWKARGVNTLWDYQLNQSWLGIWNQAAEATGMKIIRNASTNPADDIGDPNLLAYLQPDEPDIQGVSAATLQQNYNFLKANNPSVPVLLNVSAANVINELDPISDSTYQQFAQSADVLSSDVYPLSTYGNPSYIDLVTYQSPYAPQWDRGPANPGNGVEVLRNITQSVDGAKPEIAFIETSLQNANSSFPGARAPTADEFRGEVWDSIIHGARGICYFPFAFPSNSDGTPSDVVTEMTKQDALITSLAPVITSFSDSNPQEISGLPKGIEGMYRQYNGHTYYFIFNMSHTAQSNMKITLPGVGNATATVVNESRSISISGGSLTDSFGDYGLHIYMV